MVFPQRARGGVGMGCCELHTSDDIVELVEVELNRNTFRACMECVDARGLVAVRRKCGPGFVYVDPKDIGSRARRQK